jgi:polar amino acid transport system substrate-binding protein
MNLRVVWRHTAFDSLFAPGPKRWDFGVSQMTITPEREQVVDFSVGYLVADQSLIVRAGTPIENAKTTAELKQYHLGVEAGTTGRDYVVGTIEPNREPSEFDTTSDAAQALKSGTIDGQVIDLPIASGIVAESKDVELKIVGLFRTNESYGAAMEEGSPLKRCVDQAINAMKADGSLERIQEKWLPGSTGLPVFS